MRVESAFDTAKKFHLHHRAIFKGNLEQKFHHNSEKLRIFFTNS